VISFSSFGFVAVVPGDPETQTVSYSFPKLCAALQRKLEPMLHIAPAGAMYSA
jgi:hypothetical protein